MFDFGSAFEQGLPYGEFLDRYANADQRQRWEAFWKSVSLTPEQTNLLRAFVREMKVLVLAGTWCGDCVNQCPIFERFAEVSPLIRVRYLDRDDNPELAAELQTCGGARVPTVVFLSEDNFVCGRYGDRTLSRYRAQVSQLSGTACSTGLTADAELTRAVIQDWLNEFERIQWMLRTSGRLRQLHGD
jgi:thiol-disulfide isomerase/thioredoxin